MSRGRVPLKNVELFRPSANVASLSPVEEAEMPTSAKNSIHIADSKLSENAKNTIINSHPFELKFVESPIKYWKSFGVKTELFILVRPDNCISLMYDQLEEKRITGWLSNYYS